MEGEVVQVEAFVDKAIKNPASPRQRAAEGLQEDPHLLDVDPQRSGEILVDESR
jgi:hypothetical protein